MSSRGTATRSRGRQGSLFQEKSANGVNDDNKEERQTEGRARPLIVPCYQKQHILERRIPKAQRRKFESWRQEQANREWKRYVDRRLPTYSVDGYKDDPHRKLSLHAYGVNQARKKGWGDAISQKKASLRKRWRLAAWNDIRVRSFRRRSR